MSLADRIGFDAGTTWLEDALEWAGAHDFYYVDFNADAGPNHMDTWSAGRVRSVRDLADRYDIHLGLHTLLAVNVAEFSPRVARAASHARSTNTRAPTSIWRTG